MEQTAQANETAQELEKIRKERIKQAAQGGKNKEESQENQEETEKKVDKKQENDYIDNLEDFSEKKKTEKSEEEQLGEYERVLEETFGGDPKKAVKSWKESQKNYTKLRQQSKEAQQKLGALNNLVENNPVVGEFLKEATEKVRQGGKVTKDDLQNFIGRSDKEPKGKPNSSSQSKLEIVDKDVSDINEETLIEEGYLDPNQKDSFSSEDWKLLKRQASVKYAEDKLPERLASKALQQFNEQIEAEQQRKKEEETQQKNRELNSERYQDGIERVIDEFDLDFAGNEEHQEMLDDIENLAANIRDPQNRNVIHPNAIYLASLEVMRNKGITPRPAKDIDKEVEKAEQEANESLEDRMGFNKKARQPSTGNEPQTLAGKLTQKRLQEYKQEMDNRRKTNRLTGDSV